MSNPPKDILMTTRKSLLLLVGLLVTMTPVLAQNAPPPDALAEKRAQAVQFYRDGRLTDAIPLFAELVKAFPDDAALFERYGVSLYTVSASVADQEAARQMRVEAKRALTRSMELGNDSQLVHLAEIIPPDGNLPVFSSSKDFQQAMTAAEAAFSKGDYEGAIAGYQKALAIDPFDYTATLFIGDCYYRQNNSERAGEWFARAIAIDPNVETAHRYWGDALLRSMNMTDSKARFLDAIIAEPYNRFSWNGLTNWAQAAGVRLGRPNFRPPDEILKVTAATPITLDPVWVEQAKNNALSLWLPYAMTRARWQAGEFSKRFPAEPAYRHSLAEEIDALSAVLARADELASAGQPSTDQQLVLLRLLRDGNLLEPYILLHAADTGISRDYPRYRAERRDRLMAYLNAMIQPK